MATEITETRCLVEANVRVKVYAHHQTEGIEQRRGEIETRVVEVSLTEYLESSDEIRQAFMRLADIAVRGSGRPE